MAAPYSAWGSKIRRWNFSSQATHRHPHRINHLAICRVDQRLGSNACVRTGPYVGREVHNRQGSTVGSIHDSDCAPTLPQPEVSLRHRERHQQVLGVHGVAGAH